MYYQEKWVDDIMYIKTTLNGKWKQVSPTLADIHSAIETGKISLQKGLDLAFIRGKNFIEKLQEPITF